MRESTRRPIPVEKSILWKPLHDSHYVVASLQPRDGGRRKLVVHQRALAEAQTLVHASGRGAVGLLFGDFYQCRDTGVDYLVVETIESQPSVADDADLSPLLTKAVSDIPPTHHQHLSSHAEPRRVVGWLRGVATADAKPSAAATATHRSIFAQPWQMMLIVGESPSSPGGAFLLFDTVNARWFCAPFYELLDHAPSTGQPKPTVNAWPQYLTTDNVVLVDVSTIPPRTGSRDAAKPRVAEPSSPLIVSASHEDSSGPGPAPSSTTSDRLVEDHQVGSQPIADRDVTEPQTVDQVSKSEPGRSPASRTSQLRLAARRLGSSLQKLSIVDDRDQRMVASAAGGRIRDDEDTVIGEPPGRYIEVARTEGFFIANRFATAGAEAGQETLWILNEPFSGMLLTVVSTDTEVVDASLHYNLQTDDAGLQRTPFPEHRDPVSKSIYVRETCVESLRARCRRLRASNALLREWRVTPRMLFITAAEWESIPTRDLAGDRGGRVVTDLNASRIADLPPGVRSQFALAGGVDATA